MYCHGTVYRFEAMELLYTSLLSSSGTLLYFFFGSRQGKKKRPERKEQTSFFPKVSFPFSFPTLFLCNSLASPLNSTTPSSFYKKFGVAPSPYSGQAETPAKL